MYEWDEAKRYRTLKERGVDFCDIERFEWATAISHEDNRANYGEHRVSSLGKIDGRIYVCAWTQRGENVRIISLRKANAREVIIYERAKIIY